MTWLRGDLSGGDWLGPYPKEQILNFFSLQGLSGLGPASLQPSGFEGSIQIDSDDCPGVSWVLSPSFCPPAQSPRNAANRQSTDGGKLLRIQNIGLELRGSRRVYL